MSSSISICVLVSCLVHITSPEGRLQLGSPDWQVEGVRDLCILDQVGFKVIINEMCSGSFVFHYGTDGILY